MANEHVVEPKRKMMHALYARAQGGPEELVYGDVLLPAPGTADVLLAVHAASFTPTELTWPSTWRDHGGNVRPTPIPGHEVSGVVAALGYGATGFAVGDEAYGLTTGIGMARRRSTSPLRPATSPPNRAH